MIDYSFYDKEIDILFFAEKTILLHIDLYRAQIKSEYGYDPIEYCKSRIKSSTSIKEKLIKRKLVPSLQTAISEITDIVGIRIVCDFMDDVYKTANYLKNLSIFKVIKIKDYITYPKPNGYRSYHLIVQIIGSDCDGIFVEIQIRTMAIDCWASLEHQLKYKHQIKHQKLIISELKRCADEIASTDISMQTIRELINSDE